MAINRQGAVDYNQNALKQPDAQDALVDLVAGFQEDNKLTVDGCFGPKTQTAARRGTTPDPVVAPTAADLPPVVDRRKTAKPSYVNSAGARVYYTPAIRPWANVWGVMLHQTAADLGENPERWDTVGAHWGVTTAGQRIRLHDANTVVFHGNGGSNRLFGIEINGRLPGEPGGKVWDDPSTPWVETPTPLTDLQVLATLAIIEFEADLARKNGANFRLCISHRQASGNRRNDPGWEVWQRIALVAMERFGLNDGGPGWVFPDGAGGLPIPGVWDPRYTGTPY